MRLVNITENTVTLELQAHDCLTLARVLDLAAEGIMDHLAPGEEPLHTCAGALAGLFAAAGMGADVFMSSACVPAAYSLEAVRKEFAEKGGQAPPAA